MCTFSAEFKQGDTLTAYFCSDTLDKCPFVLVVGDFSLYESPQRSAEVLSSVPKSEKAVRRKYMLYKLCSGMSYRGVGPEFKVYESTIYI